MRERFGMQQLVQTPLGGRVVCEERDLLYEEAPAAYKNIEALMWSRLEQMQAKLVMLCTQQIPGDTHRNLQILPEFSGRTFKHVLVPVWLLSYTYGRSAFQVIVNGSTGAIAGRYPKSLWKILGLVALGLVAVAILLWLNASQGGWDQYP